MTSKLTNNSIFISNGLTGISCFCKLVLAFVFFVFFSNDSVYGQVYASASANTTTVGSAVSFYGDDYSSNNVQYWDWDFDDGNYSYSQNPSHSFSSPGTYNVYLQVTYDDYSTDGDYVTIIE